MQTLNIFVSGTIDDQRAERNTVGAAIESLRLDATRAETQYSSERCPRDECLKMVRECDVYLGVYTQTRYGWIIPEDNISVTELEFNEALRLNKPILIFVQQLPKNWTPQNDDEEQQRERQRAFLNRVLDLDGGKFRAPEFESLAQLQDQVAGSLMRLLIERFKMTVTRPPFYNVPRQLDVFVGREAYIQDLSRRLTRGETALVHGFYGVGGLGKTALALELAYRLRHHFDGGVLWADLPTTQPDQTLAAWAREYGADLSRIEETHARADALRGILRGKRVLAILDGAVDEADNAKIAPLLRALAECAVIVTSRVTQLDSLAHAHRVDLDRMSEDEAVALFERIMGKPLPREKIIAIARVVDFLPLALDLAAAQWREHRQSWTADDVLALLRDERARLDTLQWGDGHTRGIRASIQVSYNRLSKDEQRFFAALGVFAGDDFDVRAVAFVVAEDEGRTTNDGGRRTKDERRRTKDEGRVRETLERFLRLSLVQEGRRAMRYRLHPLLRDFAREMTTDRERLSGRMARYYCNVARENGPKLQGAEAVRALEILDLEWGNIDAGQAWASGVASGTVKQWDSGTVGQLERERWELCRDYIGAMMYYFNLRAMWNEWITWSEAGIAACQRLGDARGEGTIIGNLGIVYLHKGAWDKAIEFYQNALATMEQLGDRHGMAQTYNNLGLVYANKGAWDKAIEFYQNALATMEQLGDRHGMAQTYNNLGLVYANKGEWDKAIEFYQNALATMEQLGDRHGMAQTYNNLGLVYANKGEWDKAIEFYQQLLAISEQLGDRHGMAQTYNNLGLVYANKGEWDKAIEFYQKDLAISEQLGDRHGMAQTYNNLGLVYADKGAWDKAIEFYQQSLAIKEQLGDRHGMAQTFGNLGSVYLHKGAWDKAIEFYQQSLAIKEQLGDRHGMAQTFGNLGSVYLHKGAWDKAIEFYQQSLAIKEQLGDRHGMAQTFGNLGSVYLQKGAWDKAIEFYQNALATMEQLGDRHGMAQTYTNLGSVYLQKGEWDKAIEFYQNALATMEQLGDRHGMAQTYTNLGLVYANKGAWDKAIEFYQNALATMEQLGDIHGMAQTYNNLGLVYADKGAWDKAIEFYQNALATMEQLGDRHGMAQTYNNLGLVYADKGAWDKAIEFYQQSLAIKEQLGDRHGMAQTFGNLGIVYERQGKIDDAIAFYKKSLEITERLGDVVTSSNQYWNLGTLYESQGKIAQAIELMEKAMYIWKQIGSPYAAQRTEYVARLRGRAQRTNAD